MIEFNCMGTLPIVGTLVIKIGSQTYETDVSIEPKKTGSPNSTLIRHFKRNVSSKVPIECYGRFGKLIGHSEPDIKHVGICFDALTLGYP